MTILHSMPIGCFSNQICTTLHNQSFFFFWIERLNELSSNFEIDKISTSWTMFTLYTTIWKSLYAGVFFMFIEARMKKICFCFLTNYLQNFYLNLIFKSHSEFFIVFYFFMYLEVALNFQILPPYHPESTYIFKIWSNVWF